MPELTSPPASNGQEPTEVQSLISSFVLPALYLLSGSLIILLRGERRDRKALAMDVAQVQEAIGELIGIGRDVPAEAVAPEAPASER